MRRGDEFAATKLWDFLYHRMRSLASNSVSFAGTSAYDEDDIANSAIAKLFTSMRDGHYDGIDGRESLWKLAAVITLNKAKNRARSENAIRRGRGFSRASEEVDELADVRTFDQDPATVALMKEECESLLNQLQKEEVKMVALLKIEGFTNEEIAGQLGCTRRSVQRRLNLIRETWNESISDVKIS